MSGKGDRRLIFGLRKALKSVSPTWVAIFIIILGVTNIISSIIALPTRGLVLQILTRGIVQASGFSELVVGWILTMIGYGLYRKYRLAWQAALILLSASIILNTLQVNFVGIGFSAFMLMLVYFGGLRYRRHFPFYLNVQYIAVFWAIVFATLYGTVGSLLYGNEFIPPIDNYIRAFYFTVTTITTVGYGDIVPDSDGARLFTSSLIIVGVAVFLSTTLLIGQSFFSRLETISENARRREVENSGE